MDTALYKNLSLLFNFIMQDQVQLANITDLKRTKTAYKLNVYKLYLTITSKESGLKKNWQWNNCDVDELKTKNYMELESLMSNHPQIWSLLVY